MSQQQRWPKLTFVYITQNAIEVKTTPHGVTWKEETPMRYCLQIICSICVSPLWFLFGTWAQLWWLHKTIRKLWFELTTAIKMILTFGLWSILSKQYKIISEIPDCVFRLIKHMWWYKLHSLCGERDKRERVCVHASSSSVLWFTSLLPCISGENLSL